MQRCNGLLLQNAIKNDVARFNQPRIKPVTNRHFQIPIRPGPEQKEPLCGYATSKSLFIYVLIYLIFIYIYLSIYRLYMEMDFTWKWRCYGHGYFSLTERSEFLIQSLC